MNTLTAPTAPTGLSIGKQILSMLWFKSQTVTTVKAKPEISTFLRHIRVLNPKTNEYYHNRGGTVLCKLDVNTGTFEFSFVICHHDDTFNKHAARVASAKKLSKGDTFKGINYDPEISILQNIYIAIGALEGMYPLTEYNWKGIIPELDVENITEEQLKSLSNLRRLIRNKANNN